MENAEQIYSAVNLKVEAERRIYSQEPEPDAEPEAATQGADVLEALQRNEDGDAELFVSVFFTITRREPGTFGPGTIGSRTPVKRLWPGL